MGAVVFNFSTLQRGAELEEGANQIEALFRFVRAQAAGTGRQIQITFEEDVGEGLAVPLGNFRVLWEPDPIAAPGLFEPLPEADSFVRGILDQVSVEEVRLLDDDSPPVSTEEAQAEAAAPPEAGATMLVTFPPLLFHPDGSSDSGEIILASRNPDDPRRLVLRLTGVTGGVRREFLTAPSPGLEAGPPEPPSLAPELDFPE